MYFARILITLCIVVSALSPNLSGQSWSPYTLETDGGIVVSDSAIASRIGRDVLAKGGNAVDAAVATAFALAVTWPEAGNIGGGGFMLIRPADGSRPVCIDYRETAPLSAKENSFEINDSRLSRKAVGVPGTVRGLELAHQKYGSLPWKQLVMPAAKLALGFNVDQALADSTNSVLARSQDQKFAELRRVYQRANGAQWQAGDTMKLPELARTLEEIAIQGPDAFYSGRLANLLVEEMKKGNGMIQQKDLDNYQAKVRKPIIGQFRGFEVIGAPPPSSGGICVVQALNLFEALQLSNQDRYGPETMHLIAEVCRRIFLDRAKHLGDPDFTRIPEYLTTKKYARELAAKIDRTQASSSEQLAPEIELAPESDNTTHFSVVDSEGMAVSNTYTLEASWGSRMVVTGAGYVLNNEMGDFNWIKGLTNRAGRIGTPPNLLKPGKRMLSSQCPVIVTRDDKVCLVTGSPGGRTIINTVLGVILNYTHFGMTAPDAVAASRFHHQWLPDQFQLEAVDRFPNPSTVDSLRSMGHRIVNRPAQGSAHSIWVDGDLKVGIGDSRRSGRPAGFTKGRIACWNFGETRATTLSRLKHDGYLKSQWLNDLPNTHCDGNDHLLIQTNTSGKQLDSLVFLDNPGLAQLTAIIEFDGIQFEGDALNEQIGFGFNQDKTEPLAQLVISRDLENRIILHGKAGDEVHSKMKPVVLADTNQFDQKATFQLSVDTDSNIYSVAMRAENQSRFQQLVSGKLQAGGKASFLRLSLMNDFGNPGERIRVERIEVRRRGGSTDRPPVTRR